MNNVIHNIPFHRPYITEDEINEVVDSLRSGWLTMGPKTLRFEEEFSRYLGAPNALSVSSCTAAMHLALVAMGLKPGDEVIVPDITFTATAEVVCYFGARPVIVDVDNATHNMDVAAVDKAITPKTRAIMPVHYGGQPCDMDEILEIARVRGLTVIEDAAHALPATYRGRKVGTIGDLTCFSFYVTKTLCTGEGGMVTTENNEWAERIRTLRLHGISKDAWKRYSKDGAWFYEVVEAGYKYNMTDIQAALGVAQLKKIDGMWERRIEIVGRYTEAFSDIPDLLRTPLERDDRESAWHLYVIKLNTEALKIDRSAVMEALKGAGVSTSVHFIPLHRHPFYRDTFGLDARDFPVSENIFERIISLPIYPGMSDLEVGFVIDTLVSTLKKFKR